MMSQQCCKACVFAKWERTPSGRISSLHAGRCLFEITLPQLPGNARLSISRSAIWPDEGTDCETFQAKEGAK